MRDVLLSGGDPLLLPDRKLHVVLSELRSISHVEIIRIGTRVPCTLPQRVTPELANLLKGFHPLYINTHFNHPREITPEAALACTRFADAGIPMGCQTVLLKGVNDDCQSLLRLNERLFSIGVLPYYLHCLDRAAGVGHFEVPAQRALALMQCLQEQLPGYLVPKLVKEQAGAAHKIRLA